MTDNGTQLFVACNPDAFIYNASTGAFAQVTDPDFPGAVTVGYLDGYFVFNEPNSQRFWVTSLNDGTQIDPLDFVEQETDLLAVAQRGRQCRAAQHADVEGGRGRVEHHDDRQHGQPDEQRSPERSRPQRTPHMCSIITCPKPEHDTCVAPSIRRAKS